ncbi:hypothetical protein Q049_02404, partial [Pseudomonas aeruginosa BWHPSA044]
REQFGEEGLIERIQAIVVQPFDLERGPLLRVSLVADSSWWRSWRY